MEEKSGMLLRFNEKKLFQNQSLPKVDQHAGLAHTGLSALTLSAGALRALVVDGVGVELVSRLDTQGAQDLVAVNPSDKEGRSAPGACHVVVRLYLVRRLGRVVN